MPELPILPPKWHSADYSTRAIANIRDRLNRQVLGKDRPAIAWLLEEIDWLNQQLDAGKRWEPRK